MVLRCLLVSLVASLGFELPSGKDVNLWTSSSQTWVSARATDLSALGAEAAGWLGLNDPTMRRTSELDTNEVNANQPIEVEAPALSAEFAFELINEDMALSFADDQARLLAATIVETAPVTAAETIILNEPDGEALALADSPLNPESGTSTQALAGSESTPTLQPDEVSPESSAAPTDRLYSAVRLTREAVHAWASLAQAMGSEVVLSR